MRDLAIYAGIALWVLLGLVAVATVLTRSFPRRGRR